LTNITWKKSSQIGDSNHKRPAKIKKLIGSST
jgi:hypothetical protein